MLALRPDDRESCAQDLAKAARIIFHKPTAGGDGASERAECFLPEFSLVAFS